MSYNDPTRFPSNPVSKTPVLPADVLQFAPRKDRVGALPARLPNIEIPSFLKRGPRAEEEVMPSDRKSWASRQGA
jgi:hypothetical protein